MSTRLLREMLTYCRPAGSRHEILFRRQFLECLPGAYEDHGGNIHVHVTDDPILWSAHTDTVHRRSDRQHVLYSGGWIELPERSPSSCLGADDTAGCYLLRQMILARVPGHYIFHYGEEIGGQGSSWIARNYRDWLRTFKMAIALDRAHTTDVITHQAMGRTASHTFALALAAALGPDWSPTSGIYTDTAEYADDIPECTNLSVGYEMAHSRNECLDVSHVQRLLGTLLTLDLSTLPIARNPDAPDPDSRSLTLWSGDDWTTVDNADDCDCCDWLIRRGYRGFCPACGEPIWSDDQTPAYLTSDAAAIAALDRKVS